MGGSLIRLVLAMVPWAIIATLIYVALFVKPAPVGETVQPSAIENRDRYYGAHSLESGALWLVGAHGKIIRSGSNRESWEVQSSPEDVHFQDIAAWDDRRAIAVGNGGTVIVTEDGGESWARVSGVPSNDVANKLVDVKTYGGGEAWAVGEFGTIIRSDDYGQSWQRMRELEDVIFNEIVRVNPETLIVVGEFGLVLRSSDNGLTWDALEVPTEKSLTAVAFRDGNVGVIAGLEGVRLATHDGGEAWQIVGESLSSVPSSRADPDRGVTDVWTDPVSEHIFAIRWVSPMNMWVATGAKGIWLTGSPDARQWRSGRLSDTEMSWHTSIVALDRGVLFAGQNTGVWSMDGWAVIGN